MASIVVVGGGVAGLASAWLLRRAGHVVEVLEREPEAGGRMRPPAPDQPRWPGAVLRFYQADVKTRRLATRLGLSPVRESAPTALWDGTHLHPVDLGRPLRGASHLPPRALAATAQAFWRARRGREGGARGAAGEPAAEAWLSLLRDEAGGAAAADAGAATEHALLRRAAAGLAGWQPSGGVQRLPEALAAGVSVRGGCEVLAVETETGGARVRYRAGGRNHLVLADAVVVAMPADRVASLCPKLTPDERGFFAGVRFLPSLLFHARLTTPTPLRFARVRFPVQLPIDLRELSFHATPEGGGILRAELRGQAVAQFWAAEPSEIDAWLRERIAPLPFSVATSEARSMQRFAAGHARFAAGHETALHRFHDRIDRSPRLFFAGDALDGAGVEGAVASAERVAAEVGQLL